MAYAIRDGYQERPQPGYFIDADPTGTVHQPDVYSYAADLALERGCRRIVDVGCGRAGKLDELHDQHPEWSFVGVDYGTNIAWCRETYSWGEWLEIDLDQPHQLAAKAALIVCADAIEHLRDPLHLLNAIRASGCAAAVLSTPERDLTWGTVHNGPPPNTCHVREWNRTEFASFLDEQGFTVEHVGLTRTDDLGTGDKTILAVVTP